MAASSSSSSSSSLKVNYVDVTPANLGQLRKLNTVIFPVQYKEPFYKNITAPANVRLTKMAYYNASLVGAISTRLEDNAEDELAGYKRLYIMTLGVLAPYRDRGLGSQLLTAILEEVAKDKVSDVYLHVQVSNDGAVRFYERHGFRVIAKIDDYYRRVEPKACYILSKPLIDHPKANPPSLEYH